MTSRNEATDGHSDVVASMAGAAATIGVAAAGPGGVAGPGRPTARITTPRQTSPATMNPISISVFLEAAAAGAGLARVSDAPAVFADRASRGCNVVRRVLTGPPPGRRRPRQLARPCGRHRADS